MIRTWIADISYLYDDKSYREVYNSLPDFRKTKADRIHVKKNKAQSVGVWALLEAVRHKYNISKSAVFNLSHSGDFVLCSIDMDEREDIMIGCDLECVRPVSLHIAERFYCKREYEHVLGMKSEEEKYTEFFRYWVLKESFMKATRLGMKLDIRNFEIELRDRPVLISCPENLKRDFYFREYGFKDLVKVAVCSSEDDISTELDIEFIDVFKA